MNETLLNLTYEIRKCFWKTDLDTYCEAMSEICTMHTALDTNINNTAKILIQR